MMTLCITFRYLPRSCGLCRLCGIAIVARGALVGRRSSSGGLVPNGSSISDTSLCSTDPGNIGDLKQNKKNEFQLKNPINFNVLF